MKYLSKNICFLRKLKGDTQAQMAAAYGIKRTAWNNYESGVSSPGLDTIFDISKDFDLTVEQLVNVDISEDVHLIEKIKSSKKQENVHLNVHPIVHPSGKKEAFKGYSKEPQTAFKHGFEESPGYYMSIQAKMADLYEKVAELATKVSQMEAKISHDSKPGRKK